VGLYAWLWNKDRTRYAGLTIIPKHLLEIEDRDKRNAAIAAFEKVMVQKPLTDEEKSQQDELDEIVLGSGPPELLDDDEVDAIIAWSEGRGKYPSRTGKDEM